jgi:hypothetical protein
VAPRLANPRHACWLISSGGFRRRHYPRRGAWVHEMLARCPDPREAFESWMARDDDVAAGLAAEAASLELPWMEVVEESLPEETAAKVALNLGLGN